MAARVAQALRPSTKMRRLTAGEASYLTPEARARVEIDRMARRRRLGGAGRRKCQCVTKFGRCGCPQPYYRAEAIEQAVERLRRDSAQRRTARAHPHRCSLTDNIQTAYLNADSTERRLLNQSFFRHLAIDNEDISQQTLENLELGP